MKRTLPLILVLAVLATGALYLWSSKGSRPQESDAPGVDVRALLIQPDQGLNIEYAGEDAPEGFVGERVIFERYRFLDPETEDLIDLRREKVTAMVTNPAGVERAIAKDRGQYLVPIYPFPFVEGGTYSFRIAVPEGPTYTGAVTFPQPEWEVVTDEPNAAGDTRLFRMSNGPNEEDALVYVTPDNIVRAPEVAADGSWTIAERDLAEGEHVFLLKRDGGWHIGNFFKPEAE